MSLPKEMAFQAFDRDKPQYIVIGLRESSKRSLPIEYVRVDILCQHEIDVFKAIASLSVFRVYDLTLSSNPEDWSMRRNKWESDAQDQVDRELYEKLKAKFEK